MGCPSSDTQAALDYPNLSATDPLREQLRVASLGYASPRDAYVSRLADGVATISAAFWPRPVIVRMSDFKSNEYRRLIGGDRHEPEEENPMLAFRGASRYYHERFRQAFRLECDPNSPPPAQ